MEEVPDAIKSDLDTIAKYLASQGLAMPTTGGLPEIQKQLHRAMLREQVATHGIIETAAKLVLGLSLAWVIEHWKMTIGILGIAIALYVVLWR
jgi:hypothetical protein